jgi:hypothetical protein
MSKIVWYSWMLVAKLHYLYNVWPIGDMCLGHLHRLFSRLTKRLQQETRGQPLRLCCTLQNGSVSYIARCKVAVLVPSREMAIIASPMIQLLKRVIDTSNLPDCNIAFPRVTGELARCRYSLSLSTKGEILAERVPISLAACR